MAVTVEVERVRRVPETGRYYVEFVGGYVLEFATVAELQALGEDLDSADSIGQMNARRILIRYWIKRDPAVANLNFLTGRRLTLDLAAAEQIRVTGG